MPPRTSLGISLLILGVLLPAAPAQKRSGGGITSAPLPGVYERDWPLTAPGPFHRMVAAQLTPDLIMDAVLIDGRQAHFLYAPTLYVFTETLLDPAHDVAILPGVTAAGRDAVALVNVDGLHLQWMPAGQNAFTQLKLRTSWAGALLVRGGDINRDGRPDLVGLQADRVNLLSVHSDGSVSGSFADGPSLTLPYPAADFYLGNWQNGLADEVFVMDEKGFLVMELNGTPAFRDDASGVPQALAVLTQQSRARDRLAVVTTSLASGEQSLTVWENGTGGVLKEGPIALPDLDVAALVAGDYDGDGDDDLVLSLQNAEMVYVLINERSPAQPSAPSFTSYPANALMFDLTDNSQRAAPGNVHTPALGDFDQDGDLDPLVAVESETEIVLLENTTLDLVDKQAEVAGIALDLPDSGVMEPAIIQLTLQESLLPAASFGASHVEVVAWKEPLIGTGVKNAAHGRTVAPLTGTWPLQVDVPIRESTPDFQTVYFLDIRFTLRVNGELRAVFPTVYGGFSVDQPTIQVLEARPGAGATIAVLLLLEVPFGGQPQPILVGGFVPQSGAPLFAQPGVIPDPQ